MVAMYAIALEIVLLWLEYTMVCESEPLKVKMSGAMLPVATGLSLGLLMVNLLDLMSNTKQMRIETIQGQRKNRSWL